MLSKETQNKIIALIANENETVLNNREKQIKIEFDLSGFAKVKKGEDFMQSLYFAIPWEKMVAVLLSKLNGVTVEKVLRDALNSELDANEMKLKAKEALKEIKGMDVRPMSGKLTKNQVDLDLNVTTCEFC